MLDSKEAIVSGGVGAGLLAIWNWFQNGRAQGRLEATYATKAEVDAKLKEFVTKDIHCLTHTTLDKRLDTMEERADQRHAETMDMLKILMRQNGDSTGSSARF